MDSKHDCDSMTVTLLNFSKDVDFLGGFCETVLYTRARIGRSSLHDEEIRVCVDLLLPYTVVRA